MHVAAHGTNSGRRWGTEQLNRSMFLTLVAQFQTYCRDLHDEAVEVHLAHGNVRQEAILRKLLTQGRRLDVGNPRTDALENDFSRLGFKLLSALRSRGQLTGNDSSSSTFSSPSGTSSATARRLRSMRSSGPTTSRRRSERSAVTEDQ